MDNETLFYICGIGLAVSAVVTSFIGLKARDFPGKAFPVVILWFAILVGGATTFAVLHAKDEEHEKAAEFEKAGEEIEADQTSAPFEKRGPEAAKAGPNSHPNRSDPRRKARAARPPLKPEAPP